MLSLGGLLQDACGAAELADPRITCTLEWPDQGSRWQRR